MTLLISRRRHAEQKAQPGHDAIAVTDADAGVGQVQLEGPDVLTSRRVGRPLQKRSKPLTAADVASLRARAELARIHIFNHTLTQRGDRFGCHRQLLSWVRFMTPRSSRQGSSPATHHLSPGDNACRRAAGYRVAI